MAKTVLAALGLIAMGAIAPPAGHGTNQGQPPPTWPQWRGPLASGIAPTGDPPTTWSEKENIRWKVPIPGSGASTPIIWGDTISARPMAGPSSAHSPA